MSSLIEKSPWRLEWQDGLSVGIPEIDADHQRFARLVNELNEAIIARMGLAEIKKRLRAIQQDAIAHFAHEEQIFKQWGYPEAEEHARKHAEILQCLQGIMGRFESGGLEYEWVEAGLEVKNALIDHLLAEDMKYRDYWHQNSCGKRPLQRLK
ncbi:bacteriohemerythrin [Sideroxyarcus sp. TK5]